MLKLVCCVGIHNRCRPGLYSSNKPRMPRLPPTLPLLPTRPAFQLGDLKDPILYILGRW